MDYNYEFSMLRQNKDYIEIKLEEEQKLLENLEKNEVINNIINNYNLNELSKQIIEIDSQVANIFTTLDIDLIALENHKTQLIKLKNIILDLLKENKQNMDSNDYTFYNELINNINKLYKKINMIDINKKISNINLNINKIMSKDDNNLILRDSIKSYTTINAYVLICFIIILIFVIILNIVIVSYYSGFI